jgi:hypothetical protein
VGKKGCIDLCVEVFSKRRLDFCDLTEVQKDFAAQCIGRGKSLV